MSQHDYVIDNAGGAAVRADINAALQAVLTLNSGPTAPSVTKPFLYWYDTSTGKLKQRNAADSAWVDANTFTAVQQGGGAGQLTNKLYIGWDATVLRLQIDGTDYAGVWPISVSGYAASLDSASNYTIKDKLSFYNGGVGGSYIQSNDATWGFIYRPSVNGSNASHLWTNAAGAFLGSLNSAGEFAATTFNGAHKGTIDSATTATTQTSTDSSTKVATTAFVQANKPVKAWGNFTGSTGSLNGSLGLSSVTRTSTGEYTVNLSSTQPNSNYAPYAMTSSFKVVCYVSTLTTTSYKISAFDSTNGTATDGALVFTGILGA